MVRGLLRRWVVVLAVAMGWLGGGLSGQALADDLTIAAASNLNVAFKDLAAEFEKTTGRHVKLSFGSSGNLFSQIQNGAPFDLFFSADVGFPQKLVESGHAEPGSFFLYAVGRLVVWVPNRSSLSVERRGIEAVADPAVRKVAIANPKHAPYGRAAVAALRHYKLYERVKDRLVLGENISQTAQFVESGSADIGIIALALALTPAMQPAGRYWEIPADTHPALEQGAVLLKKARNREEAEAFLAFLKGARGRAILRRYGYETPD